MTNKSGLMFRRFYGILLSISILLAGVCLIAGCLSIYFSDDGAYSGTAVAETFASVAAPVYLCITLTVIGFIFELFLPSDSKAAKGGRADEFILARHKSTRDLTQGGEDITAKVYGERRTRKTNSLFLTVLICVLSAVFLVFALDPDSYTTDDINGSVIGMMYVLIPCSVLCFGAAVYTVYRNGNSIKREIELLKQLPAAKKSESEEDVGDKKINAVRYGILLISIGVLVFGFVMGGTADVLTKAINICTECIGLG